MHYVIFYLQVEADSYSVIMLNVLVHSFIQIKLCDHCQRNAPQLKIAAIDLQPIAVVPKVWYLVGVDLIGPFKPFHQGYKFVLTITNYFSKYVEVVSIVEKSAISVASAIYKVYCQQGTPVHIITDQGKEFVNQVSVHYSMSTIWAITGYLL